MGIDRVIADLTPPEEDPLWVLVGLADSPGMPEDLALRHDDYLDAEYQDRRDS